MRPIERQLMPVWMNSLVMVFVTRSCLLLYSGAVVMTPDEAVAGVGAFSPAHKLAISVYQTGTEVSGIGPQVSFPIATVAPALAPTASW